MAFDRATNKKAASIEGMDLISILANQVAKLSKKLDGLGYQNSIGSIILFSLEIVMVTLILYILILTIKFLILTMLVLF